jgi:guanylate kinase
MSNEMRKALIIVVGPSGVGKSSLLQRLLQDLKYLRDTTTFTTRSMRAGESEGNPYHFVTKERFEALLETDFFVEWALVHGNYYGTPVEQIDQAWRDGRVVIMDVDIQGARSFKAKYKDSLAIFIHPPSFDDLRYRLIGRDGSEPRDLAVRLESARREIAQADLCDAQLINSDFDQTVAQMKKLIDDFVRKG